jgi:hypothetical protein
MFKRFSAVFLAALTIFLSINLVLADAEIPPVSGIEISEYEDSLVQQAGTSGAYEVKVKNIGVLGLRNVKLESEKIPDEWFSSDASVDLEFGETGVLQYELAVPEAASGLFAFSLIARGSYGAGIASDIQPIVLNVLVLPEPGATTGTTSAAETTQPPIVSISEDLPKLIENLKYDWPEFVFSKFRAGVTYVRTTAKAVLTDKALIYNAAGWLFVFMLVLAGISKFIMG